ncbi:TRAP transporter small permease [Celeribacter arenosi]|uniref:TRAP transporter small permease protein n=1 Tax=Celeribacter arenosi TaxID=792649 RepID=A0ABP7JVB9_9RHOB
MDDDALKPPRAIQLLDTVLSRLALVLGGTTLLFMTAFSVWNVLIMRKVLNNPIVGAEDLLVLALVVIVALSVPLGARTGAHIEIEVLENTMSAGFAKWSMIIVKILGFGVLAIMSWRLWHAGETAAKFGETTQQLLISYGPFYYLLAVSIGIYAVVVLLDIWQLIRSDKVIPLKLYGDTL